MLVVGDAVCNDVCICGDISLYNLISADLIFPPKSFLQCIQILATAIKTLVSCMSVVLYIIQMQES